MSKASASSSAQAPNKASIEPLMKLQRLVDHQFNDISLLKQAMTHKSAHRQHNERLEFLGDAVLGMVVGEHLYKVFPDSPEGQLTRMRSAIVKGDTLAEIALEKGLGEFIQFGAGELKSGGKHRYSILADVVESIIGAIYLDAGMQKCHDFIHAWFGSRITKLDPQIHPKDAKTRLQEYLQSRAIELPVYEVVDIKGKDHNQTFVVSCVTATLADPIEAQGPSRKRAEQRAAQLTLEKLQDDRR